MPIINADQTLPLYTLQPDETGNKYFRLYSFEGTLPDHSELLIPHRKDHYLLAFIRKGGHRHWVDMTPYVLKNNTFYFSAPASVLACGWCSSIKIIIDIKN